MPQNRIKQIGQCQQSSNHQQSTDYRMNISPSHRDSQGLQQRKKGDMQTQLLSSYNQDLITATKGSFIQEATLVRSNDVEERDRYRYQWRKEDRQRVISDRLELLIAVVTGLIIGWINNWVGYDGAFTGVVTGILIWLFTGLVRNRWSP